MRLKLLATFVIFLLLLGLCSINAKANFSGPCPIQITILSPNSYERNLNSVFLNVSITVIWDTLRGSDNRWVAYSVDGKANVTMTPIYHGVMDQGSDFSYSMVTAQAIVSGLDEGYHNITVYAKYTYGTYISPGHDTVDFTVGTPKVPPTPNPDAPTITINTPSTNQVFAQDSVILYSITLHIPPSWFRNNWVYGELRSVGYILDNVGKFVVIADESSSNGTRHLGSSNETTIGLIHTISAENSNIVLTGNLSTLPVGSHTVQFSAFWIYPEGSKLQFTNPVVAHFSVATQATALNDSTSQPTQTEQSADPINQSIESSTSSPTMLVVGCVIAVAVVAGLLAYITSTNTQNRTSTIRIRAPNYLEYGNLVILENQHKHGVTAIRPQISPVKESLLRQSRILDGCFFKLNKRTVKRIKFEL